MRRAVNRLAKFCQATDPSSPLTTTLVARDLAGVQHCHISVLRPVEGELGSAETFLQSRADTLRPSLFWGVLNRQQHTASAPIRDAGTSFVGRDGSNEAHLEQGSVGPPSFTEGGLDMLTAEALESHRSQSVDGEVNIYAINDYGQQPWQRNGRGFESGHKLVKQIIRLCDHGNIKEAVRLLDEFGSHLAWVHYKKIFYDASPEAQIEIFKLLLTRERRFSGSMLVTVIVNLAEFRKPAEAHELVHSALAGQYCHVVEGRTYGALCKAYAECGDHEGVQAAIQECMARGLQPQPHTFTLLMRAYGQAKKLPEIRALALQMLEGGLELNEHHLISIVVAHSKVARGQEAQDFVLELEGRGVGVPAKVFSALINGHAEAKDPAKAQAVLGLMADRNLKVSRVAWNTIMKAWSAVGAAAQVREVMAQVQRSGLQPDAVAWTMLLHAYGEAGLLGHATRVMEEMRACGVAPSEMTYNTLINALAKAGDYEACKKLLKEMDASGTPASTYTYTAMLYWGGQMAGYREVLALFEEMEAKGIQADWMTHAIMLEAGMAEWDRKGRPPELLEAVLRTYARRDTSAAAAMAQLSLYPSPQQDGTVVDLHNQGAWGAQLALLDGLNILYQEWSQGRDFKGVRLYVVTGKGNRSRQLNDSPVRRAVLAFLQRLVPASLHNRNEGVITVQKAHVLHLFEHCRQVGGSFDPLHFQAEFEPAGPAAPGGAGMGERVGVKLQQSLEPLESESEAWSRQERAGR